jgi:hypothetical protein
MSFLRKLFGGGGGSASEPDAPTETYKDFQITARPAKESGGYRIGALIEKEVDGETRQHHLIRADQVQDRDEAQAASVRKAKQVIDEQGERIFN